MSFEATASSFSRDADLAASRRRLEALARLLDGAVTIPVLRVPVGLDAALSLLPGAGAFAGGAISAYVVIEAARLGVSQRDLARMLANVAVDTAISSVPVIGVLGDIIFRANKRNMAILRSHLDRHDRVIDHDPEADRRFMR